MIDGWSRQHIYKDCKCSICGPANEKARNDAIDKVFKEMTHYLSNEQDRVVVQMYAGTAMGVSFPRDPNKHNEEWEKQTIKVKINGKPTRLVINTYEDGDLISIELDLPENITKLSAHV